VDSIDFVDAKNIVLQPNQLLTPSKNVERSLTLDGLRGVAALAVAVRHAPFLWIFGYPTQLFHESYLSVDFFFVLSGFVLTYAYDDRFRAGMSVWKFISVRLIRLYPLYALAFAISFTIAMGRYFNGKLGMLDLLLNTFFAILFVPSPFSTNDLFPMNNPAWSLFFELVANFVFGLVGRRLNAGILVTITFLSGVALILSVSFGWFGFGTDQGPMAAGNTWISFIAGSLRVIYSFFCGSLVFRLWRASRYHFTLPPVVLICGLCTILIAYPPENYAIEFDLFVTLVAFPLIVFIGAGSSSGKYTSQVFVFLGNLSYAIYVLQFPLYELMSFILSKVHKFSGTSVVLGATCVAFSMLISILADQYFDRPVRRVLTRYLATAFSGAG
jgi:peptidoglycan/LPS O-acetylase OafA/YrhL